MEKLNSEVITEVVLTGAEDAYKSGAMQYIDSREVAEMVGKEHNKLLRDIRQYINQLDESKIGHTDFFTESQYTDKSNRHKPCYLVTKKGCEFIAHKLTGIKGTKFTATYINRFHEMEDTIKSGELAQIGELTRQLEEVRNLVQDLRNEQRENQKILVNPFNPGKSIAEGRLRNLNIKVSEVSSRYGLDRKKTLHYLYQTIEQDLGVSIDEYLQVYRDENKDDTISTLQVVSANTKFYNKALELIKNAIERKKVFG